MPELTDKVVARITRRVRGYRDGDGNPPTPEAVRARCELILKTGYAIGNHFECDLAFELENEGFDLSGGGGE